MILLLLFAMLLVPQCMGTSTPRWSGEDGQRVHFNRDVRPLLSDRCFHCHGRDQQHRRANLRLDQADGVDGAYRWRQGSRAIQPGSLENSAVWYRLTTANEEHVMPPSDSHKQALTDSEKAIIRRWILQGAEYEDHWAFVAPESLAATETGNDGVAQQSIDYFVRRKLAANGLEPAPRADKRTLIRRVTFDLTGLPPTLDEIRTFLSDTSGGAYERLLDRLLAKLQFGEHMARYWLDLARFADTNGVHHDHYRDMTPYRDWVIRSFNSNLPYDQFVTDQLAGDLRAGATDDQLTASGFNRLHMIIDRGTALPEESFTRNVVDRVTAVGTVFLGLTLQCAVCHDHKYDPFGQKDFYQLFAFFNNLDAEPETGGRGSEDFRRGLQQPYISFSTELQERALADLARELAAKNDLIKGLKDEEKKARAALQQIKQSQDELPTASAADDRQQQQARDEALEAADDALEQASQKHAKAAKQADRLQRQRDKILLSIPAAMVMKERQDTRPAHVLIRGAYDDPGESVTRDTPAFLPPMKKQASARTRLDLAEWLVAKEHPLTARVAVNRFWQQLFGVGIVKTSEDFGTQGERPSHPELLDYLAVAFVESGWDVKALLKSLVMSHTYQQVSVATPAAYHLDPENRMLARGSRYRMDAEMIRDQILATSGLLNPRMFGKSVKPPQPDGIWRSVTLPDSLPRFYSPDSGDKTRRRSVYTFWKRGMPPPQMSLLNAPTRESCTTRRERTNTPLQALLLWNESEYFKAARQLAHRALGADAWSTAARLSSLYERITSHVPDRAEAEALLESLSDLHSIYREKPELAETLCRGIELEGQGAQAELAAWTMVVSAIYNLDITKTRQ